MRSFLLCLSLSILALNTVPPTAQACGGYGDFDPARVAVQQAGAAAIAQHFASYRRGCDVQTSVLTSFGTDRSEFDVYYQRSGRPFSQNIELTRTRAGWRVSGGTAPVFLAPRA